jgi:hypothetical protein
MPIEKRGNRWVIHNVKGSHATYGEALAQLQAIQINKKKRRKGGK